MLKIENVTYRYKGSDRAVLDDVSCVFEAGRLSAVMGPSGSGKTTLLSIMAGMDKPTEGTVSIDGENLSGLDLDRYRRERVAVIFQSFHLFPLLPAMENVCFPMELNGAEKPQAKERAAELLRSVGIGPEMHKRYPSNLSGGEQQRVAIARSMASGAKLLLADEPTGNLDLANTNNVIDILKKLAHEDGYCVVVVTHDTDVAAEADVIYKMRDGVLTQEK
jgi:putative ABC transport system ATP-binding protein